MKTLKVLLAVVLLPPGPALATKGDAVAHIGSFQFEQGGRIEDMDVG